LRFGLVWFGSVARCKPQTESRGSVQKSSEFIRTKCGFLRFRFGLVWFAVFLFVWFGYEHPYLQVQLILENGGSKVNKFKNKGSKLHSSLFIKYKENNQFFY